MMHFTGNSAASCGDHLHFFAVWQGKGLPTKGLVPALR